MEKPRSYLSSQRERLRVNAARAILLVMTAGALFTNTALVLASESCRDQSKVERIRERLEPMILGSQRMARENQWNAQECVSSTSSAASTDPGVPDNWPFAVTPDPRGEGFPDILKTDLLPKGISFRTFSSADALMVNFTETLTRNNDAVASVERLLKTYSAGPWKQLAQCAAYRTKQELFQKQERELEYYLRAAGAVCATEIIATSDTATTSGPSRSPAVDRHEEISPSDLRLIPAHFKELAPSSMGGAQIGNDPRLPAREVAPARTEFTAEERAILEQAEIIRLKRKTQIQAR